MTNLLTIGAGGFIGSVLRYLLSGFIQSLLKSFEFPYGTLVVNILGCFFLGLLAQFADAYGAFSSLTRAFLFIGILGGFTTFSTFSGETINLFRDGEQLLALLNITMHVVLGLGAVWIGRSLVHAVWS